MATLFPTTVAPRGFISTDQELAAVDRSVRWPVMICFLTGVHWMVVGTVLLVYASSLTHPMDSLPIFGLLVDLSNNFSMFTYGRLWPAAIDALVYGWGGCAGLGLAAWLLARMSREPVHSPGALIAAIIFWNLGVAGGITGIFVGQGTSVELLEFPYYVSWMMWFAFAVFALWTIATFVARRPGNDHLGQAWILAGLFCFPWLYAAGNILLARSHSLSDSAAPDLRPALPGSGVIQEVLGAWYFHGVLTLWLAPIALGALYYLIPKVSGLGIRFGDKAKLAFWLWLIFAPWTAVHDLVGGPFPADTVTVGMVLSGLLFIPVAIIGFNLVFTAFEAEEKHGHHGGVVFPFVVLAAVTFVLAGFSEQLLSIRSANVTLRFTLFRECNMFLWIYGFFSFAAFGSIYYIVPRLLDFGWRSSLMVRIHYYLSLYGILLMLALLCFGGAFQGLTLENPDKLVTIEMATQVANSYHIAATMCISLIAIGNGAFALHLGWMLIDWLRLRVRGNRLAAEILVEPYEGDLAPAPAAKEEAPA
jgi:cytochrome c oxidase cbb3-type subunit 1